MFNDPKDGGFPEIPDGQYILRCERIEDAEPGSFGARVKWVFLLWNAQTREPVVWENDGSPYEWWRLTSTKTGEKSTARKYMQAFLNRDITTSDTGAGLAQEVIGKYALAMLSTNDDGYPQIVSIKPYVQQAAQPAAAPAPAPEAPAPVAAAPAAAPAAPAGGPADPFAGINDDDLPFHHSPRLDA